MGRHHHSTNVLRAIYWNSGQYNTYRQGNTGNSSDENVLGGQFIDGTNCRAELDSIYERGEIYYVSPNADNLYYGMTVWRSSFRVYRRDPYSFIAGYVYTGQGVPLSAGANANPIDATRLIFESGDKKYDHYSSAVYSGTNFNSPVGM